MIRIIDSHAHYLSETENKEDINLINNSETIEKVVNIGMDDVSSVESVDISSKNDKFYSSIGIHPEKVYNPYEIYNLEYLMDNPKVVALGETGMDKSKNNIQEQIASMVNHIELANKHKLPVIIHSNGYNEECLRVVSEHTPDYGFVFHCFQPNIEIAEKIIRLNGFIGVAGKITLLNAKKSIELLKKIGMSHVVLETDSPYMTPYPITEEINNSTNIIYTVEKISTILCKTEEEICSISNENVKKLYKRIQN